jgi:O-antigen ligase
LGNPKADVGVPVKDYIAQSSIFAICALGLLGLFVEWRTRRPQLALAAAFVAALFFANIVFVATARTTLVLVAVLLLIFGFRQSGWKGIISVGILGGVLASLSWVSSPYLRGRVTLIVEEVQDYPANNTTASIGVRLEYWKKSIEFIAMTPMVGHGTGTIATLFQQSASGHADVAVLVTGNPHNQIFAVAIQLGFIGTLALIAMWIAHLALFDENMLFAWFGLVIVVGNIVSSLFNTHLFDFTHGWLYVFGIGITGGAVLSRTRQDST